MLALPFFAAPMLFGGELTLSAPLAIDNITHSSARACWTTAGGVLASKQVAFDTTANFTANHSLAFKTVGLSSPSFSTMCMAVSGLTAGTSYTVCPSIADGSGNSTNCTSSGSSNSRATFTTSALPGLHPALAAVPSAFNTSYPTIDVTLTVANDCSDLTSKLTAAYGAANAGNTVKVVYPSLRTQTSANCNHPLNLAAFTKSGGGTVVITSSDEASGPMEGVRTSTANKNQSWMLCSSGYTAALTPTGNTRLVDLYLQPCDSNASYGQGDPLITAYLARFDNGPNDVVFDRVNFDGRGYPYRVMNAAYGYGNNIAFVDSYFNRIEIWEPWVDTTSISVSGNQIVSALPFLMGHGEATNTIGAFSVSQSAGTGVAYLSVRAGGAVEYRYSNGSASCNSPCTAVLDPAQSLPSDAIPLMWNGSRQISYTSGTFGSQAFWSHSNISALSYPDASHPSGTVRTNEWDANGIAADSCAGTAPTAKQWVLRNDFLGVTGFGVFPQGGCLGNGPGYELDVSDWTITNNAFQSNNSCLVAFGTVSHSSSPFVCTRRHHFETKNGYRFNISHNTMSNGFIAVSGNGGYAVDIKQDLIGAVSAVTDLYIGYNTITNDPACFYIAGDSNNSAPKSYSKLVARVQIEHNMCQPNALARSQFFVGTSQDTMTNGGMGLWIEEETEDVIFRHNTIFQPRGSITSAVLLSDRWSEGLSILNNIFYLNSPYTPYRGIQTVFSDDPGWSVASTPAFNTPSGSDGITALSHVSLLGTNPDVRNNLFIAGCLDTSACTDSTPAASLVGNLSTQYPPSNFWIATGTFGARQDAVGWINRANVPAGLYLSPSSPYHNAGTDQLDIGVTTGTGLAPGGNPPAISITSPTSGAVFSTLTGTISVGGTASADAGLTQVSWVTDRGDSGIALGTTNWTISGLALQPGSTQITVTAHDATGNVASSVLTVTYTASDTVPPTITITSPTSAPTFSATSNTVSLSGTASDNVGVTQVTWVAAGRGSGTASGTTNWTINGLSLAPGTTVITVTAHDAAGNLTSSVLTVTYAGSAVSCDLNGDGKVNVLDVQLATNQTLGYAACGSADVNGDSKCTVIDIQRIISTSLGAACRLGP
jgi:hypothetical protein